MLESEGRRVVLYLPRTLGRGGAEMTLTRLVDAISYNDFRVVVAGQVSSPGIGQISLNDFVKVIELPRLGTNPIPWIRALAAVIRKEKPDVVHSFAPLTGALSRPVVRWLARHKQVRLVHREPSPWESFPVIVRVLNSITYSMVDESFAVSENVRLSMRRAVRNRTISLFHGVDVERLRADALAKDSARDVLKVGRQDLCIGSVGSLKKQKDYVTAIRAAGLLKDRGLDFSWLIIGDGAERRSLERLITELKLQDRVQLVGERQDAPQLLGCFDLFVNSSLSEGMPVALVESLSMGIPSIATALPASLELSEKGFGLETTDPGDIEQLADTIAVMLRDEERRILMSRSSHENAYKLDIARAAEILSRVYLRPEGE